MNPCLRVPATRSVLLRLRRHHRVLAQAAELLEHKRRILAQKAFELLPRWEELHAQAHARLAAAFRSFTVTRMRGTAAELRQIVGGMPPLLTIEVRREVLSGVPTFQVSTAAVPLRPRFGLLGSTAELENTIGLLRDATAELARLAALRTTLRSLAHALRKTARQVHILRDRLLPTYQATIRSIEDTLDEQERDYLFQLKHVR
jgi:V/A-type H+-transporting ATPase subunit D